MYTNGITLRQIPYITFKSKILIQNTIQVFGNFKRDSNLPITGPKNTTKSALPTKCQPKADGNFSSEQYSETVRVKLLSADPLKNPHIESHTSNCDHSVCSAITMNISQIKYCKCKKKTNRSYFINAYLILLQLQIILKLKILYVLGPWSYQIQAVILFGQRYRLQL